MKVGSALFALGALLLVAIPSSAKSKVPFNPADYAAYDSAGTGTVTGQAFLKTKSGEVRYAIAENVYLDPATPHSEQALRENEKLITGIAGHFFRNTMIQGASEDGFFFGGFDKRAHAYQRKVETDPEGHFRFEHLPAGDYFVTCLIQWEAAESGTRAEQQSHEAEGTLSKDPHRAGYWVLSKVHVGADEVASVYVHDQTYFKDHKEVK